MLKLKLTQCIGKSLKKPPKLRWKKELIIQSFNTRKTIFCWQ